LGLTSFLTKGWKLFLMKSGYYNTHIYQKTWTRRAIKSEQENLDSWSPSEKLGDYNKIKEIFLIKEIKNKSVLEIGCLNGRWSGYLIEHSKKAILCDLSKDLVPLLERKFGESSFEFYETKGYELDGLSSNSVDFIFSMDTFVRVNKKYLKKYFKEFRRVLKISGQMLLHLPINSSTVSNSKNFVNLSREEITALLEQNNFTNYIIDEKTINHGCLVLVNYGLNKK